MTTSLEESYQWCKSLARRAAGNFYFSFLTLPADRFRDMCVLYAFMRVSDDLGDDPNISVAVSSERLAEWRNSLKAALNNGQYLHPVFPALMAIVREHEIPHEYLYAVIEGVSADLGPVDFETFDQLADYCYQVAGVVGLCCIHIWGFHDERARACAVDCGLAFQLTNILRDLAEDARMGRVYLPREDLRRFGYSADDIADSRCNEPFVELMKFEVERAKQYYSRAGELFDFLDPPGKPIFSAMLRTYRGLLGEIERRNYDVYRRRVRLPRWRKLMIAAGSIIKHRWLGR